MSVNAGMVNRLASTNIQTFPQGNLSSATLHGQLKELSDLDAAKLSAMPAGTILQTLQAGKSTQFSTSSGTPADITGLSKAITPAASANQILVRAVVQMAVGVDTALRIVRDSTAIGVGTDGSIATFAYAALGNNNTMITYCFEFLDSPGDTSAHTYKVQMWVTGGGTGYVNRRAGSTDACGYSSITVMEVKG